MGEPTPVMINGQSPKLPASCYVYSHVIVQISSLIRLLWSAAWLTEKPTIVQNTESKWQWNAQSQMKDLYYTPSHDQGHHGRTEYSKKLTRSLITDKVARLSCFSSSNSNQGGPQFVINIPVIHKGFSTGTQTGEVPIVRLQFRGIGGVLFTELLTITCSACIV